MKNFRELQEAIEQVEEAVSSSTLEKELSSLVKKLKSIESKVDKKKVTFSDRSDQRDFESAVYDARTALEDALNLIDR